MSPLTLPGEPGPKLIEAWEGMDADARSAFLPHLLGTTSADWLSQWLDRWGTGVSATTIKTYRLRLKAANGDASE